jgi:hypothetical protein
MRGTFADGCASAASVTLKIAKARVTVHATVLSHMVVS